MSRPLGDATATLRTLAAHAGIRRITMLAWRDLDDPEAGGSEVHAANVASRWSRAGIDVTMRTSFAAGHRQVVWRNGYRSIRKAGRYLVFPRAAFSEVMGWHGESDALVEIWNGMPFFSPLWTHKPRAIWLHHVHDQMWQLTLPPRLAQLGRTLEFRIAPPIYRRTSIVTLSESSRNEIVEKLRFRPERITVVPPGIDAVFSPGRTRAPIPLVLAVGRLVPVKRFDFLIEALTALKPRIPNLRAIIAGEGYERETLQARIDASGAADWISMPGRVSDDELLALYRRAWVLACSSLYEGWGMTITEAAACGTPAVATRIAGHSDALVDGASGFLVEDQTEMTAKLESVLCDSTLREALSAGAQKHAARFTWDTTAYATLSVLAEQVARHRRGRGRDHA
jgi:glycosyltransferase involved in cell wall biosynthesis